MARELRQGSSEEDIDYEKLRELFNIVRTRHSELAGRIACMSNQCLAKDMLEMAAHGIPGSATKTVGRMYTYMRWRRSVNKEPFPLTPGLLFEYAGACEHKGAPPNRAQAVHTALKWLTKRFGLRNGTGISKIFATTGAIKANPRRRGEKREAPPSSVEAVTKLEEYLLDADNLLNKRILVGTMLFIKYARLRWDDAADVNKEPKQAPEEPSQNPNARGTVATSSAKTKANQTTARISKRTPMVCNSFGITSDEISHVCLSV